MSIFENLTFFWHVFIFSNQGLGQILHISIFECCHVSTIKNLKPHWNYNSMRQNLLLLMVKQYVYFISSLEGNLKQTPISSNICLLWPDIMDLHQKCKVHNVRSQQTDIAPKTSAILLQLQRQKQLSSW